MPKPSRVAEQRASRLTRIAELMQNSTAPDIILINRAVLLLAQIEAERQRNLANELAQRE